MSLRLTCSIFSQQKTYDIKIIRGLLLEGIGLIESLSSFGSRFAIVTDDVVSSLYGQSLASRLNSARRDVFLFSFPHGEQHKTRETKERLEDQLLKNGLGRDTCLIALGGGVVMDVAGYLAATYCRGLPLVLMPTTLLAMVDACIGGKTGVNVPQGKNLIGCIYQPAKVLIDSLALKSLSLHELKNGLVEIIKHGLIADASFFQYLEQHAHKKWADQIELLEKAIFDSCRIKKEIVEQDEQETGKRRLLNFGHTVGHALENLSQYTLPHGQAVAVGMVIESCMAVELGYLEKSCFERLLKILSSYALDLQLPMPVSSQTLWEAMMWDKKSIKGLPRMVVLNKIGSCLTFGAHYCTHIEEKLLQYALKRMNYDLCCH